MGYYLRLFAGLAALLLASLSWQATAAAETILAIDRVVYPGQPLDLAGTRNIRLRRALPAGAEVVRSQQQLAGKLARRTVLPNRPIPLSALRDPYLVESGKPVRIFFRSRGITIGMTGVALSSGLAGDLIRVRNIDSGKTIVGTIRPDASVEVLAP